MPEVIVVRNPPALPRRQGGVALMVLITLAALGGMAFYLSEFNAKVGSAIRTESIAQTRSALREARDVLLGASVSDIANGTSRERPGQLPWPDRAENNSPAYDGWSDCVTSGFNVSHLIGRFPFRGELNCVGIASAIELGSRFVDGTGEPLWYAVSRNLLNTDRDPTEGGTQLWPINPDIVTGLPSNTGWNWLRVCDTRGRLVSDRVAAVIIAPGAALENQNRKTVATQGGGYQLPGPQEYLDSFAVVDTDGTPRPVLNHDSDDGPDSLGLAGVGQCREKGTAGEEFIMPVGLAADERAAFNDELVYITIDEIVEAVQLRAMNTIANALNKHRAEVEDVMKAASPSARGRLPWLSPFGSAEQPANDADSSSVLTEGKVGTYDSAAQTLTAASDSIAFDASMIGAAIRNLDDGSTAVIRSVDEASGSITISDMVGGLDNTFAPDDTFQIPVFRADFYGGTTEGQIPFGAIQEVFNEKTKTVEIVTVVEDVVSDFRSEWDLDMTEDGALFDQASIANGSPTLAASHRTFAMSSERTGPVQIRNHPGSQDSGVCRYLASRDIRCQGIFYRTPLLSLVADVDSAFELKAGTVTNATDTDQSPFDFSEWGVGPGSIVRNMGQPASGATPSQGIVNAVSVGGESDRLSVVGLTGGTTNQFSAGDLVDILPAGREVTGTATGGSTSVLVDVTPGVNFIDAQITEGDIVTDGSGAYAYITSVSSGGDTLTLGGWTGTGVVDFSGGAVAYNIYSGHVAQRRIVFDWYLGDDDATETDVTSETGRSVTFAKGKLPIREEADAATLSQLAIPPGDDSQDSQDRSNQTILVQDLDAQNQVVAESAVTIESGTKGALEVSGIPREFIVGDDVSDDLPTWVIINGWHQFLYVAYGDAFRPDAVFPYVANSDGTCPAQSPCLTVYRGRTTAPQSSTDTARADGDVHAVVVGAGVAVEVDGVAQVRPSSNVADYFEGENAQRLLASHPHGEVGDLEFEFEPDALLLPTFNDAIKLLRVQ